MFGRHRIGIAAVLVAVLAVALFGAHVIGRPEPAPRTASSPAPSRVSAVDSPAVSAEGTRGTGPVAATDFEVTRRVKAKQGASAPATALRQVGIRASGPVVRANASRLGYRVIRTIPSIGVAIVEPVEDADTPERLAERVRRAGFASSAEIARPVYPAAVPNDTYFTSQWGLQNTGQSGGVAGADSKATAAWDWARGAGTVVAVVDTGVDFANADLTNRAWVNADEIPGNGVDDDANGFIDDVNGWDFIHDDATVFDAADGDMHGTHVAGTIGAETNDARGAAGMCWDTRIMSLKFINSHSGSDLDGAAAIDYAVHNGADVINCSWGSDGVGPFVALAIEHAAEHGVLVVCAAGNAGQDTDTTPYYPASLSATNVVSVAALDRTDALASFSNRGASTVDLGAPGVSVLSTTPRLPAGLLVDRASYRAMYLAFPIEAIFGSTSRRTVMAGAMGQLATTTADPVLVVDDAWQSLSAAYETPGWRRTNVLAALSSAGYSNVTTWSTEASGTPPVSAMQGKTVVWFTGAASYAYTTIWPDPEVHGTLTTAERTALGTFLDGGGRLLISSGDLGWEMMNRMYVNGALSWYYTYLRARFVSDDPAMYSVRGTGTGLPAATWSFLSTMRYSDGFDEVAPYDASAQPVAVWPHDLMYMDGTSMAAPHVTGAIALALSRTPTLTAEAAKQRLLETADPVAALQGVSVTGARLDAASLVGTLGAPADLRAWPVAPDTLRVAWANPADADYVATRVLVRADALPSGPNDASATVLYEGTATSTAHAGLSAGQAVHYAAFARAALGGWSEAAVLSTAMPDVGDGTSIPAGEDITVTSGDVTLTFPWVSAGGWLSVTRIPPNHEPPDGVRWVGDAYYDIHPVGEVGMPVEIALAYDPASVSGDESELRLYHRVDGAWQDVTTGVDAGGDVLHARTASFSDFALGEPADASAAAASGPVVEASADGSVGWALALLPLVAALFARRRGARADV